MKTFRCFVDIKAKNKKEAFKGLSLKCHMAGKLFSVRDLFRIQENPKDIEEKA